ncbi:MULTISPECIES: pyridoxamine 5'-phosphate oxidase family protein [unclassified Herbaspirillum]|uniref:FAD-binding oxidoreductase n=1 Tax=unclassified Herbaspirillum TaxID=2624150 RepID=UPI000E2EA076|nr:MULTISPECIES: pyridoxamine 5'-phosphate oxidase family protein [unclassified Herbaspirillum]RFB68116.1 FAD-binding oxidoreductase [Herbaspirillum sp. 3R-3a1]TFI06562.1 2Fe-2S iron-sulfur cluster binding domain-containing protein [Herbaspirillum sp. 3R11]TFI13826.1 2Fe-2S iron-sulfur cluster binding domain-containing protein [Herbaspirillum sp. 3R-11]TFI29270.1 2Fe-2S iron-sulfur cluster binding domain-containing protein [Herbaspirillum sp. 3C11]
MTSTQPTPPPANSVTSSASPWHEGELTMQRSVGVGVVERMAGPGRSQMGRTWMPDQHRQFYAQLPFVILGAVDTEGEVWATLRAGRPGFMHADVAEKLTLELARDPLDPADAGMEDGDGIGMLGIELHTRRRNRMNGLVSRQSDQRFHIDVTQAYGNCPQYIQLRQYEFTDAPAGPVSKLSVLDADAAAMIRASDSFYVASYVVRDGKKQVDASHRGGKPGFVRIDDDGVLTIPDFSGNLFFNTLGNFLLNPRAGLVFVDFRNGDLLQLSGRAEVILNAPEVAAFMGAERMWRFTPQQIVRRPAALPLRWIDVAAGASPNALITGSWEDAAARLKAAELATQWRPFRVSKIVDETAAIRSFHLQPNDGAGMPGVLAGQHVSVRLPLPEGGTQIRQYTLSSAPSDAFLRISVKRQGLFSDHLHTTIKVGDIIEARAPAGNFVIDASVRRPAVLLAAGVGVTPMLAMLRHLIHEGMRKRYQRPVWLFQSARSKAELAFGEEIAALVNAGKGGARHVRVVSQADDGIEASGRIDIALLKQTLPFDDYDFYLCGPASFMQQMYDGLRTMNVTDARIHAEAFGPSGLQRQVDEQAIQVPLKPAATDAVPVLFMRSAKEARWTTESGSLLELAEQRGLNPESSCRDGRCGTCRTRVLQGEVTYAKTPEFAVAEDEALICCAMPAQGCTTLHLEL